MPGAEATWALALPGESEPGLSLALGEMTLLFKVRPPSLLSGWSGGRWGRLWRGRDRPYCLHLPLWVSLTHRAGRDSGIMGPELVPVQLREVSPESFGDSLGSVPGLGHCWFWADPDAGRHRLVRTAAQGGERAVCIFLPKTGTSCPPLLENPRPLPQRQGKSERRSGGQRGELSVMGL